jgi:hypothetical protein
VEVYNIAFNIHRTVMNRASISTWSVLVSRFLHLTGGLQATAHASGHLILYPTTQKKTVEVGVSDEQGYSNLFSVLGLDFFGYEEVSEEDGIRYSRWNFHSPDHGNRDLVVQIWRQIDLFRSQRNGQGNARMSIRKAP